MSSMISLSKGQSISLSKRQSASTKIASFSVDDDGCGNVMGTDGTERATFKVYDREKNVSGATATIRASFDFKRSRGEQITITMKIVRDESGLMEVSGDVGQTPFKMYISGFGKLLKGSEPPRLKSSDKTILSAMVHAFEERGQSHFHAAGCALAWLETVVCVGIGHPLGIAFGIAGIFVSC